LNLTKEHFIIKRPNYSLWDFKVEPVLQNYLINLGLDSEDLIKDREISNYIKDKTKQSLLFEIRMPEIEYITKIGLSLGDCFIIKENVTDKFDLLPFAQQDRSDEGDIIRKVYYLKTENINNLTEWFKKVSDLIDKGLLFYLPQLKVDRQFDTSNYIEENANQIKHLFNNGIVLQNIEPLFTFNISHFNDASIEDIVRIIENEPDVIGRFNKILINGLLKIKNCSSKDSRKLVINEIKSEWEYKLRELMNLHKRLKTEFFSQTQINIFASSILLITGFFLEKGLVYFLIPGGGIIAKQAMEVINYYKNTKQLKDNEYYFLYLLKKGNKN
jgi:hypothetical protein